MKTRTQIVLSTKGGIYPIVVTNSEDEIIKAIEIDTNRMIQVEVEEKQTSISFATDMPVQTSELFLKKVWINKYEIVEVYKLN